MAVSPASTTSIPFSPAAFVAAVKDEGTCFNVMRSVSVFPSREDATAERMCAPETKGPSGGCGCGAAAAGVTVVLLRLARVVGGAAGASTSVVSSDVTLPRLVPAFAVTADTALIAPLRLVLLVDCFGAVSSASSAPLVLSRPVAALSAVGVDDVGPASSFVGMEIEVS